MNIKLRKIEYIDSVELWNLVHEKYGIDACSLPIDAHHEVAQDLLPVEKNGDYITVNFKELIARAKHKSAKALMEAYYIETKEFQDKHGDVTIYYWW